MIHAGGERKVTGGKPMAGGEERIAGREVEPFRANVAAFRRWLCHLDDIAVAFGVFLNDYRVGAVGHHAAGKDARRLTRSDPLSEGPARRDLADDFQAHRGLGDIAGAHRITVHRRQIGRRLCAQRFERVGENETGGLGQRHLSRR